VIKWRTFDLRDRDQAVKSRQYRTDQSDSGGNTVDSNNLMLSFFFGLIGMGMFMYGKKASRLVPMFVGAALMGVPYFIPNPGILLLVCCCLSAVPWFLREA
jgi:hypothetical protein